MDTSTNPTPDNPLGVRTTPSPGGSPYTLTNNTQRNQMVVVTGGTVTTIQISCNNVDFDTVGLLAGMFFLPMGWFLRINYAIAPSVVLIS